MKKKVKNPTTKPQLKPNNSSPTTLAAIFKRVIFSINKTVAKASGFAQYYPSIFLHHR